jgi:hypothetical protein
MYKKTIDVGNPATTKDGFGNLIDALYEIIYEGSGSLKRIDDSFKKDDFVGFTIKHIRSDLRHDLERGDAIEVKKKKERLAKIYEKYSSKTSLSSLTNEDFPKIQVQLLRDVKSFLEGLKQYCINAN